MNLKMICTRIPFKRITTTYLLNPHLSSNSYSSYLSILPEHDDRSDPKYPLYQHYLSIERLNPANLNDVLHVFDKMLQRKPPPTSIFQFNLLIADIVKMKHYAIALSLYKRLYLMRIRPNRSAMNISVNCYCRLNQVKYGFALLATFFKICILPNVTTYMTLINGLVLADRVSEAVELYEKLLTEKLCNPNKLMYGTIIKALCKVGHIRKALDLLDFMEKGPCKPRVEHYNAVIDRLCKDKKVDDALEILANMTENGVRADVVTYNALIWGLCNVGREMEAARMLKAMEEEKGVYLGVDTFTILVNYYCKQGAIRNAMEVVEAMERKGLDPDVITYSALIDGYCLRGELDDAKNVVDRMMEKNLIPDVITYSSLIKGYCKKNRIDEAVNLFREIPNKGLVHDVASYNCMLQGLFDLGNPEAAGELFKEMQGKGQVPNIHTYRILFRGMCKNGQCSDAVVLFRSLGSNKLMKDLVFLYSILIYGCSKCGKHNLSMDLFDELLSKGLKPDMKIHMVMIRVLCQKGLFGKAKELFRKMEDNGFLPNNITYNAIIVEFLKKKEYQEAEILLSEMINRGFLPDYASFERLLPPTPSVGQSSRMQTIIHKLKIENLVP